MALYQPQKALHQLRLLLLRPKLTLGASGEIIGTNKFNILAGGELAITGAAAKVTAKKGVTLNGGTISVAGAATDAVMDSSLNVTAGTVTLENAAVLTVNKGLTVSGGKVAVGSNAAATLTVKGDASFSGAGALKIGAAAGKLSVSNGNVTFGESALLLLTMQVLLKLLALQQTLQTALPSSRQTGLNLLLVIFQEAVMMPTLQS